MGITWSGSFTVNDVGAPEEIIAHSYCRRIALKEDPSVANWPTTNFRYRAMRSDTDFVEAPAGMPVFFENLEAQRPLFVSGQKIALIETVTGSTSFQQIEED